MWAPAKLELEGQEGGMVWGMETPMQARREGSVSQSVDNSMGKEGAHMTPADSSIAARSVMGVTHNGSARTMSKHRRSRDRNDQQDGKRPRYMRFVFGKSEVGQTPSATYMEIAPPVPRLPTTDYQYQDITRTLSKYPHFFKIVTPIHADRFAALLSNHPNQPLVKSICFCFQHDFS